MGLEENICGNLISGSGLPLDQPVGDQSPGGSRGYQTGVNQQHKTVPACRAVFPGKPCLSHRVLVQPKTPGEGSFVLLCILQLKLTAAADSNDTAISTSPLAPPWVLFSSSSSFSSPWSPASNSAFSSFPSFLTLGQSDNQCGLPAISFILYPSTSSVLIFHHGRFQPRSLRLRRAVGQLDDCNGRQEHFSHPSCHS